MNKLAHEKITLLLLLSLLRFIPVQAQESATTNLYGKVSIASPTAASLGKYADIPVNYHTGIPQISVPLYTVAEGPLSLPISLSYHAGGVKVQEPAGWVGAGWALNAGGVITRTVVGGPDERGTSRFHYRGHFTDYGYNSYLKNYISAPVNNPELTNILLTDGEVNDPYNIQTGHYDTEPDLFFFNFNGYSGKFFFSDDRTPVLVEDTGLTIEYYYPTPYPTSDPASGGFGKSANIQGFIITTPNGDRYYFGITDNAAVTGAHPVETTFPFSVDSNGTPDQVYSSYYLSKIVAADGVHTIKFTYRSENYSFYTISTASVSGGNITPGLSRGDYGLVKNNIDGVRLTKIEFSNGYVEFNAAQTPRQDLGRYTTNVGVMSDAPNDEAKALGDLTVHGEGLCKSFAFEYGYFEDPTTPLVYDFVKNYDIITDKKRLRLNRVVEKACDGTAGVNPWQFEYQGNFLPRRLSFAQDHWGFHNGRTANNALNTFIPTFSMNPLVPAQSTTADANALVPGADRDSAWPAMGDGVLTKISYPTGGSSTFVYEPNTAWISYTKYEDRYIGSVAAGRNAGGTLAPPPITLPASPDGYRITLRLDVMGSTSGTAMFYGPGRSISVNKDKPFDEVVLPPTTDPEVWTLRADDNSGPVVLATARIEQRVIVNGQENALAGGLRIKTVTTQAGAVAPAVVTNYAYEQEGKSTATLYSRPRYVQTIRNDFVSKYGWAPHPDADRPNLHTLGCVRPDYQDTGTAFLASPSPIVPMFTTQGNHLGYDQVTVSQPGNGRTDYYYHGAPLDKRYEDVCYRVVSLLLCDPRTASLPAVPLPYDFNRGQLKFERVFSEAGQLLKESQYTYRYDSSKTITPVYIVKSVAGGGDMPNYYEKRGYWKTQMETIETTMGPDGQQSLQIKKTYKYGSPHHRQLTRLTTAFSANDVVETRNTYVEDLRVATVDALNDGSVAYTAACLSCDQQMSAYASGCERSARAPGTARSGCVYTAYLLNRVCRANARKTYIAHRRSNFTNTTNNFRTAHDAAKGSADALLKPILQLQDDHNNALVETSRWKNDKLLGASYTTFGPGLTQPTVVYPAQVFSLPLSAPAATFAPAAVNGTSISTDRRYAPTPETARKFDKGNLVEVLPKDGVVTSYLWGHNYTLPIAQATGTTYATLNAAYSGAGGDLTRLRAAPTLARALLTTYVHKPLVGLASQTDPTGRTATYEYDALGRLLRTRDERGRILSQQQYHYAGH